MVKTIDQNLRLVRDFVNTHDVEDRTDDLASREKLVDWLAERGLAEHGRRVSHRDLIEARAVRESLRTLLLANNEVDVDTEPATATLDGAARRARIALRFGPGSSVVLEPSADSVLGPLLTVVAQSMQSEDWARLKACRWHTCQAAFYDHAKNRSRAWCSMSVCGNREKARAFRERQRVQH